MTPLRPLALAMVVLIGAAHERAMKFAKCMRENGVSAFPDPNASGELTIDEIANGSSLDTSTAAFKKGIDACRDLEPGGFMGHFFNRTPGPFGLTRTSLASRWPGGEPIARPCVRSTSRRDLPETASEAHVRRLDGS